MPLPTTTPELSALDLLVSVVELGSMSKAAAAHQIAQPSASSRIRLLEKRLGLTLLERTPTGSTPTPAGTLVAGWAAGVLQSASELNAGVEALKARKAGRLRVVASLTIAEYLLPPWLEKFLRNRPDESVKLEVANSTAVVERVAGRHADLGFIESPDSPSSATPSMTDMHTRTVATDRLVVVVTPLHPWTRRQSITVDELAASALIVRERGSGTRDALEAALAERGHEAPTSALELGSTAAVRAAVLSGRSPTVISERAVAADLAAGSLVEIVIDDLTIERQLRAIWRLDQPLPRLASELLASLPTVEVNPLRS